MCGKDETILAAKTPSPPSPPSPKKSRTEGAASKYVKNVSSASHVFTPHCTRPSFGCFRTLDCFTQEGRHRLAPVINTKMERASIYHPSTNWMARPVCSDAGWFRWYSFPFQKCLHEDCSVRVCK